MNEPEWLSKEFVLSLHESLIDQTGGLQGVRDEALLESALSRPQNAYHYESADIFDLAAAYAEGIARNHPFLDGNKRTAFAAAGLFLEDNGYQLQIEQGNEQETVFLGLAEGKVSRFELANWYQQNTHQQGQELEKLIQTQHPQKSEQQHAAEAAALERDLHAISVTLVEKQAAEQELKTREAAREHAERVARRVRSMNKKSLENKKDFDYTRDRGNEQER